MTVDVVEIRCTVCKKWHETDLSVAQHEAIGTKAATGARHEYNCDHCGLWTTAQRDNLRLQSEADEEADFEIAVAKQPPTKSTPRGTIVTEAGPPVPDNLTGWRAIQANFLVRLELLVTLAMDTGMIVGAVWVRSAALGYLRRHAAPGEVDVVVVVLEVLADYGIIAYAVTYTIADIVKRVIRALNPKNYHG
jgi:hypothetical protein